MAADLVLPAAALLVVGAWAAALARLGVLDDPHLRAWRRIARTHGLARTPGRLERAVERSSLLRRVQEELDLARLLAVAGRPESAGVFLARTGLAAVLTVAAVLGVDIAGRVQGGSFPYSVALAAAAGPVTAVVRLGALRRASARRREGAGRVLGDTLMLAAIMTDGRGLQLEDAVRILSRCAVGDDLATLVDGQGWRRLVAAPCRSTVERYRRIAGAYGVHQFEAVADALAATHVGLPERQTFGRAAQAVYAERLAAARMRAARSRILVTVPVAGMLVPLLLLIGAPALHSISAGLGG